MSQCHTVDGALERESGGTELRSDPSRDKKAKWSPDLGSRRQSNPFHSATLIDGNHLPRGAEGTVYKQTRDWDLPNSCDMRR